MLGLSPIGSRPIAGEFEDVADEGAFSPAYLVSFDEKNPSTRSRRHEQQATDIFNALLRGGQLLGGTPSQAILAHKLVTPSNWGGANDQVAVPLSDVLEAIAAALTSLGQPPVLP